MIPLNESPLFGTGVAYFDILQYHLTNEVLPLLLRLLGVPSQPLGQSLCIVDLELLEWQRVGPHQSQHTLGFFLSLSKSLVTGDQVG